MDAPPISVKAALTSATLADLSAHVMAWAIDQDTGQPLYIGQLDALRRGAQCRCACASCGAALTAVNAAKLAVIRRPHFRHPEGSNAHDCEVLAGRLALLRALQQEGTFELPRRRRSAKAEGLSGDLHEGWVEAPAVRVRITELHIRDRTEAVLRLDDGSELRVSLTGEPMESVDQDGSPRAAIVLELDDPALIAGMTPEELRSRLRLCPPEFSWCAHCEDDELFEQAQAAARDTAADALDWAAEDDPQFVGMDAATKRETILHLEAKRMLSEAGRLHVPALVLPERPGIAGAPDCCQQELQSAQWLQVSDAVLERRFARVIPDVMCQVRADNEAESSTLFIEVTVTHPIDEERRHRIAAAGCATLEVDMRLCGGRASREELTRLIVEELTLKRWVFHPVLHEAEQRRDLSITRDAEVMAKPLPEITSAYLDAVHNWLQLAKRPRHLRPETHVQAAQEKLDEAAHAMSLHGFSQAAQPRFYDQHCTLDRVLSIRADRGIGYNMATGHAVLNAIRQSQGEARKDWTIYLIAAKVFRPRMNTEQSSWFDRWRNEVLDAVARNDRTPGRWRPNPQLLRSTEYDAILSALFPEMAEGLASPVGKRVEGFFDKEISNLWLRGRQLEEWKRANPEAARNWELRTPETTLSTGGPHRS